VFKQVMYKKYGGVRSIEDLFNERCNIFWFDWDKISALKHWDK